MPATFTPSPLDQIAIPDNHLRSRLSEAFINAVSARAGCAATPEPHDYGLDFTIKPVRFRPDGSYTSTGWSLHCQLKATTTHLVRPDTILYDIKAEAYNRIVTWDGVSPCYLVLYCLPTDSQQWITIAETTCTLQHCAYWVRLTGNPLPPEQTKKRIKIPRQNLFTPTAIHELIAGIKRGKFL